MGTFPSHLRAPAPPHAAPGPPVTLRTGPIVPTLWAVTLTLTSLSIGAHAAAWKLGPGAPVVGRLLEFFDLDREKNIPTWFASTLLFIAAALLAIIAAASRREPARPHLASDERPRRRFTAHWAGLAIVFLALSLDETAAMHEAVGTLMQRSLNLPPALYFGWMIPAAIAVLVMGLAYIRFVLALPPSTRNSFVLAGSLYIGAAIGLEVLESTLFAEGLRNSPAYTVASQLEELGEMAGIVVFIGALLGCIAADRTTVAVTR